MPDGRFGMSPRQLPGLIGGEFRGAARREEQDDIKAVLGGVALHVFEVVDHLVTDTESMGGGADARQPRFLTRGQETVQALIGTATVVLGVVTMVGTAAALP